MVRVIFAFITTVCVSEVFSALDSNDNDTITSRTLSGFSEKIQDGYYNYAQKGFFGLRDLNGPRLELDFVLPFVKLPIFGLGPLIEVDIQSISVALTAIVFLYIIPKLLFLFYPTVQYPMATVGPDRGERSFDMPMYLNSVEEFLRTYIVPSDSCSSTNSSYLNTTSNVTNTNINKKKFKFHILDKN